MCVCVLCACECVCVCVCVECVCIMCILHASDVIIMNNGYSPPTLVGISLTRNMNY